MIQFDISEGNSHGIDGIDLEVADVSNCMKKTICIYVCVYIYILYFGLLPLPVTVATRIFHMFSRRSL